MALGTRLPPHQGCPCQRKGRIIRRTAREVVTGE